ncbi:MAG: bifunctional metallophosphatase/5'-nucleotidase [Solobacterium sp.]|nr:bifunctional metallophosphatase/5'-nucleotidase [Solobacterium sp.]MBR0478589.1 bifunctional metallophosphatase/5'-nucleotidase [Solobacterium sp.]
MTTWKKGLCIMTALMMAGCTPKEETPPQESEAPAVEANGEVMILFTSDVHCGIDQGFGYAGLEQIRENLDVQGYTTILVDDGDSVQGESIGTLSKGEAIIELMNAMHYDVAIPGNHEFDYGMEQFMKLVDLAEYPYISCNFNKQGELVLAPYIIKEAAGMKIAFVGVTTPQTLVSCAPVNFQDENGEVIYGFMEDSTGEELYSAVQKAVDDARAEGADYVIVMGHLGMEENLQPWTYADVIANTTGIDAFLDGHSHDSERVEMINEDGDPVTRAAPGTKLACIGYCRITAEGVAETGLYRWTNSTSAPALFGFDNEMTVKVAEANDSFEELLNTRIAETTVDLTIYDPAAVDSSGLPVRIVRRMETNLGDFCADAFRVRSGADIAFIGGGGIRTSIKSGDITYGNLIDVMPFGNNLSVREASGQQILDALEWGVRTAPAQNGGFLQVSGLTYAFDVSVPSPCIADEGGKYAGINGARRVYDVKVNGAPLDPEAVYTVSSTDFWLLNGGDGYTMFDGTVITEEGGLDNQILIDYIVKDLGGTIGEEYADPYGQGRITITGGE